MPMAPDAALDIPHFERGEIRFGVPDNDFLPVRISSGGKASGFEADLFAAITKRLTDEPVEVTLRSVVFGEPQAQTLAAGTAEFSTLENTTSSFSDCGAIAAGNYLLQGQRVMIQNGSGISDWPDPNGAVRCLEQFDFDSDSDNFARANGINYEPLILENRPNSLAVSADDPVFRDEVNAALNKVVLDGTYEQLFQRRFGEGPPYSAEQMISEPPG